jgi:hypothetical protein
LEIKKRNSPAKAAQAKSTASNLFLNTFIFLLSIVIIYLSYSIVNKFLFSSEESEEKNNKIYPSEIIQLEVLNGCGISGVADKCTEYLRQKKFDVVNVSNYISYDIDHSMVIDRTGNMANAKKIAEALGIDKEYVVQHINEDYFLDVSLVLGKDFNRLNPYK